jgi:transcriptional regulator of acetoin/glycerol metabolism
LTAATLFARITTMSAFDTPSPLHDQLQRVRNHYRTTPWIRPRLDEGPLLRSWQRCRDAGMREHDRVNFEMVSRSMLAELDDRHGALVRHARPEVERLGRNLAGTGCTVMLFSPQGMLIDRHCHEASTPSTLMTVTRVGMNVAERCVGTTAPAIALAEGEPYLVGRDAHFCANVKPFFCVAAPIDNPRGERVGALDITSYDNVPNIDLFSLVVDAAAAIENQLFVPSAERMLLHFHVRPDLVGTALEGLVEVSAEGVITGANRAALRLLSATHAQLVGRRFGEWFDRDPRRLFGRVSHHGRSALLELQTCVGLQVHAVFEAESGRVEAALAREAAQALPHSPEPATAPRAQPLPNPAALAAPAQATTPASLRELECRAIERTLAELNGNVAATARRLRISRNTVYRRMEELQALQQSSTAN